MNNEEIKNNEGNGDENCILSDFSSIGYFSYSDRHLAEMAQKEREKISKLEKQLDYNNPIVVYNLYLKIIEGNILKTPEGMLYLIHLQDFLDSKEDLLPSKVPTIPIEYFQNSFEGKNLKQLNTKESQENNVEELQATIVKLKDKVRALESEQSKAYKNLKIQTKKTDNFIYKCVIAGMAIIIIVMLVISMLSDSPTIVNYRNTIQNEYSEWEEQLKSKENELNERERILNEQNSDSN